MRIGSISHHEKKRLCAIEYVNYYYYFHPIIVGAAVDDEVANRDGTIKTEWHREVQRQN